MVAVRHPPISASSMPPQVVLCPSKFRPVPRSLSNIAPKESSASKQNESADPAINTEVSFR